MSDERKVRDGNFVFFGGSTGIGRAAAIEIGRRGGNVLVVGRSKAAGEVAVSEIRAVGAASAAFLPGDLSTLEGMAGVADGVKAWKPELHGILHTAMAAFNGKQVTADGLEFSFALQYMARATLNRLLAETLAASGDGRIVHIAGVVPNFMMPDLDDLQFERRKWGFFKAVMGTHLLGFLHIEEASRLWRDRPVTLAAACVGATKTKAMLDPSMPLIMRVMGRIGTTPELSARNAVRLLTVDEAADARGSILRSPKAYRPERIALDAAKATKLWAITTELAARSGVRLP